MVLTVRSFYSGLIFEFYIYVTYIFLLYFVLVIFVSLWASVDSVWLRHILLLVCHMGVEIGFLH
jgi:hypothetical protein